MKRSGQWRRLAAALAALALGHAAPASDAFNPAAPPAPRVEHEGQVFELAHSSQSGNVATEEYLVPGEKLARWTQLVTVQRLALATPVATDEFLGYFEKRVTGDGASLEVVRKGRAAAVFAVRFPKSEQNDEQVMLCLAFPDPATPTVLQIVQYAFKPNGAAVDVVQQRLRSWRDKFVHQAQVLETRPERASPK